MLRYSMVYIVGRAGLSGVRIEIFIWSMGS